MGKLKWIFASVVLAIATAIGLTSCASCDRWATDMASDFGHGLNRTITVYTADGKKIAEYKGKIDIALTNGDYVKFDYDGKRYIYYNCFVESIADI